MEEVVIIDAIRTPIGKYHGSLKEYSAVALGTIAAKAILARNQGMQDQIDQVVIGNVLQAGNGQNPGRQVALKSGLSAEIPASTINEVCGSGMKAMLMGMEQIQLNKASVVLTGGIESMTNAPLFSFYDKAENQYSKPVSTMMHDGLTDAFSSQPMGLTAENVAQRYSVSREEQDAYAYASQMKAVAAQKANKFIKEIVPLPKEDGLVTQDEGIRPGTTIDKLAELKTVFKENGTVTAGNASTINDGAAMVLLASKSYCEAHQIPYLAIVKGIVEVGFDPEIMGISPIKAISKLLEEQKVSMQDIAIFEINEAFAASSIVVERELGLDPNKVNRYGGGISLGHAIGATGARIATTLAYQLQDTQQKWGVASLCVGGGLGLAMLLENPAADRQPAHDSSKKKAKFYTLSPEQRLEQLVDDQRITSEEQAIFKSMALSTDLANNLIENQISEVEIPLGVGMNLKVDGKTYTVPLATEEPSVIAAMSNGARMAGEIVTTAEERLLRGQIVLMDVQDIAKVAAQIEQAEAAIFKTAEESYPSIVKRGGGLRRIAHRAFLAADSGLDTNYISLDLLVDVKDAMGANIINTILEGVTSNLRTWFPDVEILFSILTNYATESLVTATCVVPFSVLSKIGDGAAIATKICHASDFAQLDPYRAATHNKGIMNGVEALILATGNDTRAVSAACHTYAARSGQTRGLATWHIEDGQLVGEITLPLAIATVGGATRILPKATAALALSGVKSAAELASVAAAIGLVQNLAALRALVAEGIQQGHMRMQARALAIAVGAAGTEIDTVAQALSGEKMDQAKALSLLEQLRGQSIT
ncbi:hydroxymethylglutaryl-CoA reductase, degradative [Enterococcus sp.]|uniref:hydroxymethylglutaryl-CoA reductase, degradative n=1 Tax=Enterococcus sp. TaxID=35783 RepID=UPI0028997E40|nr:hydroxymethylglutaryl-CoA reductase, degradative [Enterococcus sp.]